MSGRRRDPDALELVSGVGLAIAGSPDTREMLSLMAQRMAQALRVSECDLYEYRLETDELVLASMWAQEISAVDCTWVDSALKLADQPAFREPVEKRRARQMHEDDPALEACERDAMAHRGEKSVLAVPLVFLDAVVGVLALVEKRAVRAFTDDDLRLVEVLAAPVAEAVANVRLSRRGAAQDRCFRALLTASRAMSSTLKLDELLSTIVHSARRALDTDECVIERYERGTDAVTIVAYDTRDPSPEDARYLGMSISLDEYPADRAILFGRKIVEERISDPGLEERNRRWMSEHGEASCLNVPLVFEGEPIGLLVFLELELERRFSIEERELANALGEQAAAAIYHAQVLEQIERQNRQLGLLLESTRAISTRVELEEVLAVVARTTAEALGAEQCQIQEYDSTANTVTPIAFWQRHPDRPEPDSMHKVFSLRDEPEGRAFLEAKSVVQQLRSDPALSPATRAIMDKYGDLSYLNIPLVFGGESFGLMVLVETDNERCWSDEDIALGNALGEQAAVAIEHARLYHRIQDQAITDGLTGLFNHRYFYERLEQEIARARRYGTPVSLLMIDLDGFKAFNDRHGHLAGDAVLREIARVLGSELRAKVDIAARYGGEEFAVILPNTPIARVNGWQTELDFSSSFQSDDAPPPGYSGGAEEVGERIRRRVAETCPSDAAGRTLPGLTVSVGAAVFPFRSSSAEELVANADAALYKAKRAGKDRVESYG